MAAAVLLLWVAALLAFAAADNRLGLAAAVAAAAAPRFVPVCGVASVTPLVCGTMATAARRVDVAAAPPWCVLLPDATVSCAAGANFVAAALADWGGFGAAFATVMGDAAWPAGAVPRRETFRLL